MLAVSLMPSSGLINPATISGLTIWIDSETNVTGAENGAIDAVGDRSGLANNFTGTAPNRPVWRSGQFRAGAKHSIDTTAGTPDYLTCSAVTINAGTWTIWHVTKHTSTDNTSTTADNPPLTIVADPAGASNVYMGFSAGTPSYVFYDGASYVHRDSATTTLNDGNVHTVCWTHSDNLLRCYIDGTLSDTFTSGVDTTGLALVVGAIGVGFTSTDPYIGHIAEVMVFSTELTASTVQQLHNRAKALWI